jgi:tetratricopeptide (TPR) repeat protein
MKDTTTFWPWFESLKPSLFRRAASFEKTFQYLDTLPAPITIVETGCMRRDPTQDKSWTGDGCSTLLFDHYVRQRGGRVYSVDINAEHVEACRQAVSDSVSVHCGDSIAHLGALAAFFKETGRAPSLVYLDSFDSMSLEPFQTGLHCAKEFEAILPAIGERTLVVVDDTPGEFIKGVEPTIEVTGKGRFVHTYAQQVGAEVLFSGWQVGWTDLLGIRFQSGYDQARFGRVGKFVDPDNDLQKLMGRARAHVEADRASAAEAIYRAVLCATKEPRSGLQRVARGEACAFYARTAAAVGQYGTALDWFRDAINADPRCVDYRIESVLKGHVPMMGFQLARQEAIRCTVLEPDNPVCWRILGDAEMAMCNADAARRAYEKELELDPENPIAMLDVCCIGLDQSDHTRVAELAERVLDTDRRADGIHVKAMIANRTGNHEAAIDLFQHAIDAKCSNHLIAHWNRSLSLLALGRYKEGWAEHEYRKEDLRNPALSLSFQRFSRPLYEGQPATIDGRKASLLVHAEAGMGDNLAFVRFLPAFVAKGLDVRYECHPEMLGLITRSFPDVQVVPRAPDFPGAIGIQPFDYHLPLGSMAYQLGMDIDTIPNEVPYLKPDQRLVGAYADRLAISIGPKERNVGLCWSSGIREYGIWIAEYGRRKSMHFDAMVEVMHAIEENGLAVSLQVGPERVQHGRRLIDWLPEKPDWDDTAALIANLDLVITVDTAVAHLAGALGKPCWVMMQQDGASWHFMSERPGSPWNERSPWYPSVRIFRQRQRGSWDDVIAGVCKALGEP